MYKFFYFALLFFSVSLSAQNNIKYNYTDSLIESKIGKQIQISYPLKTEKGNLINFPNPNKDVFVYFGFSGCIPCMSELPLFFKLADMFPTKTFVYITFNSKEYRHKEFSEILGEEYFFPNNVEIIQLTETEINSFNLITGYPTRIYLTKGGKIVYYGFGGREVKKEESQSWIDYYSKILKTGVYKYR